MKQIDLTSWTLDTLQHVVDTLRTDTDGGRTTVRLDHTELGFHVDTVAAESLAPNVHSIRSQNSLDQWNSAAVGWLNKNRHTFVMNDCLDPWDDSVAPERAVIETYGIKSEMVSPIILDDDTLIGWVSVHYTRGARVWNKEEITRIEVACVEVKDILTEVDKALAASV